MFKTWHFLHSPLSYLIPLSLFFLLSYLLQVIRSRLKTKIVISATLQQFWRTILRLNPLPSHFLHHSQGWLSQLRSNQRLLTPPNPQRRQHPDGRPQDTGTSGTVKSTRGTWPMFWPGGDSSSSPSPPSSSTCQRLNGSPTPPAPSTPLPVHSTLGYRAWGTRSPSGRLLNTCGWTRCPLSPPSMHPNAIGEC